MHIYECTEQMTQEQKGRRRQEILLQDQHEIEMLVSLMLHAHGGGEAGREGSGTYIDACRSYSANR